MKTIEINLNDTVHVRLSDAAHDALKADHEKHWEWVCGYRGKKSHPFIKPEEDSEGWSKWTLWELMQRVGPHIKFDGREPVIATTIRVEREE